LDSNLQKQSLKSFIFKLLYLLVEKSTYHGHQIEIMDKL